VSYPNVVAAANGGLLVLIILLGAFVFLFVLPNRRRQRAQQEKLRAVDIGDEVLTVGGVIGRVTETEDSEIKLEIADGVVVRVARRGIATVLHPEEAEVDEPEYLEEDGDEPEPEEHEVAAEESADPEPPAAR
jgi:preprotein translocase subunit YajC